MLRWRHVPWLWAVIATGCGIGSGDKDTDDTTPSEPNEVCTDVALQTFDLKSIEPNVLILLDRSGSMDSDTIPTKWQAAVTAITTLTANYQDRIRFGLSVFPTVWDEGTPGADCPGGRVDVPVGDDQSTAITDFLDVTEPYGLTPIDLSLRGVLADAFDFGVGDVSRKNFVLLITDGEDTCTADAQNQISTRLRQLRELPAVVETFVVGFGFAEVSDNLNCYAYHGGNPLQANCSGIDSGNCADQTHACYYDAADQPALALAIEQVFERTVSCAYGIDVNAAQSEYLRVFLGEDIELARDRSHRQRWDIDTDHLPARLLFYGTACDAIRNEGLQPHAVVECPDEG